MPQFRTKKHGAHKGQVFPIEGPTGLPKGKSALKKNALDLHIQNKKELKVEVPKEPKPKVSPPIPSTSVVQNVPQKPVQKVDT